MKKPEGIFYCIRSSPGTKDVREEDAGGLYQAGSFRSPGTKDIQEGKGELSMKKLHRWREQIGTVLELPRDLACQDAVVTVTGPGLAVVENYRSIVRYTREEIILSTWRGMITISGKRLEIPCYTTQEMQVTGCISGIFFTS